jgi:hypothetical protein
MLGKSGKYLLLMTYWWILPFLAICLFQYPLGDNLPSYYPFSIPLLSGGILSLLCGLVEAKTGWWSRAGFWKKYLILNGAYILNTILIIYVHVTLDSFRIFGYFGGDPEGGFGMLYPYPVMLYLLGGMILGVWKHFHPAK